MHNSISKSIYPLWDGVIDWIYNKSQFKTNDTRFNKIETDVAELTELTKDIVKKTNQTNAKFEELEKRIEQINTKFENLEKRMNSAFDILNVKIGNLQDQILSRDE